VLLGHWFEMRARGGANDAIRTLPRPGPPKALVLRDGNRSRCHCRGGRRGLLARPTGAKIAVDGVVDDGESEWTSRWSPVRACRCTRRRLGGYRRDDQPQRHAAGARDKVGADTALAQIVNLVQQAQNSKAPGQRLADRAAFWLVLVALIGGGLTLAVWSLASDGRSVPRSCSRSPSCDHLPGRARAGHPTAIMVGTGWAPSVACCSRTRWR